MISQFLLLRVDLVQVPDRLPGLLLQRREGFRKLGEVLALEKIIVRFCNYFLLVLSYLQVLFALFALFRRRVRHRRPASDAAEDNAGRTGAKDVHSGPVRPGGFHTLFFYFFPVQFYLFVKQKH